MALLFTRDILALIRVLRSKGMNVRVKAPVKEKGGPRLVDVEEFVKRVESIEIK